MVEEPGEDYGFKRFHDAIDTVLFGRKTYDVALGFEPWPYEGKRCVVLTPAAPAARHGEEFYAGPPEPLVERLASEGSKRIYVDGGLVIQQFVRAGLVTDMTLSILPVLLGE